ncbi:O-antigen ligase family protein [Mesorhizobium sp. M0408]|uniref:O-antigen ligase family protein n=1 Tax=unclassified Mesorhizobium TaxID=325217 RepID=UPI00333A8E02
MLLAICLLGGAGLKALGAPLLAFILLLSLAYAGRTLLSPQNIPALLLTCWGLLYVGLSYLELLPDGWTRYHQAGIIVQQSSFVFLLLPVIAASQKWWEDKGIDRHRDAILVGTVILVFIVSIPARLYVFGDIETPLDPPKAFVTLQNDVMIALVGITYLAMVRMNPIVGGFLLMLVFILSATIEFRLQNVLAYFVAMAASFLCMIGLHLERTLANILMLGLVGLAIFGILDPISLFVLDPNTGWRVTFWRDALEALAETWGIGVGFGTEALRNEYTMVIGRLFFLPEEDTSFLLIGTHNAFFDIILRLGMVGLVLWSAVIIGCYPSSKMPVRVRAHAAVAFFTLFICVFSNVALQSPLYVIGVAFTIGYLQSLRGAANLVYLRKSGPASRHATALGEIAAAE